MYRRIGSLALVFLLSAAGSTPAQELAGFALLPADTFESGPTSGQFLQPGNGVTVPFVEEQPVQGFSAAVGGRNDDYLVMTDNGYGAKETSPDFLLKVFRVVPRFETAHGGPGMVDVSTLFTLRDPDRRIGFPIVADLETYPGSGDSLAVDPRIREERLLTGADLDIESFRLLPDGTFWFGDEFGPFLVHTDSSGRVLGPAVPLPGVVSPQSPLRGEAPPNARASGGFEGMALSPDGKTLYPVLEKPLAGAPDGELHVYRFDVGDGRYREDEPYRTYRLTNGAVGLTEFTALSDTRFLAIERDAEQGTAAALKTIYLVDLEDLDEEDHPRKREIVDLLGIPNPAGLGNGENPFRFPFETTEALVVVDEVTLLVLNDNNYPFSVGRHVAAGEPDDNEFILLRFPEPLRAMSIP
jgi:hypothetical protein